jgi:hypothetical protein
MLATTLITGVVGRVQWSDYAVAADVSGYRITRTGAEWSLRATVTSSNPFRMAQAPLTFIAPTERGTWRWPILSCEIREGELIARLGPPL